MRRDLVLTGALGLLLIGALTGMTRVFSDGSWWTPSLMAAGLALAVAAGIRLVGFGAIAAAVASAVGLAVFTYVVHLPAGPLIPGAEQLSQALALFADGMQQLRDEPAPTAPLPGLLLIVTSGVWVTAHLCHELAVRWRRPGVGLIPAAVLWAVPLAMPQPPGQTWRHTVPFLAGAALVLLMESDIDVAAWARDRAGSRLPMTGVVVGTIAVTVAAAVPGVLPGYQQGAWLELMGGTDPTGYQPIVDVGDRLKLPDPRPVLRVRAERPVYLRLAALDTFDTNTWRLGPPGETSFRPEDSQLFSAEEPLPPEVPIGQAEEVLVEVEVLDLENIYVPVPYQPDRILGPSREDMVYSTVGGFVATGALVEDEIGGELRTGVRPGLQYRVVSAIPSPDAAQLRAAEPSAAERAPWTVLPGADNGRYEPYARLAEQHYQEAEATTQLDKVLALQRWFTSPEFTYSVDAVSTLRGPRALEEFVFETRVGYCEYFATAMAVMLRSTGIPARVAVGFLPGDLVAAADPGRGETLDTYQVMSTDAHAWVEVLFPGAGWNKFDPTPRADGGTLTPTADDLDPLLTAAQRQDVTEIERPDLPADEAAQAPVDGELPGGLRDLPGDLTDSAGDGLRVPWLALTGLLLLGGALALTVSHRRMLAHHPELDDDARVLAAQRRLLITAAQLGVGRAASETATEVCHRWAAEGRVDPTRAARLAALAQAAAFGGALPGGAGAEADTLVDDLGLELRTSVTRSDRLLAPLRLPAAQGLRAGTALVDRVRTFAAGDRD